jgi:hypothetical protein
MRHLSIQAPRYHQGTRSLRDLWFLELFIPHNPEEGHGSEALKPRIQELLHCMAPWRPSCSTSSFFKYGSYYEKLVWMIMRLLVHLFQTFLPASKSAKPVEGSLCFNILYYSFTAPFCSLLLPVERGGLWRLLLVTPSRMKSQERLWPDGVWVVWSGIPYGSVVTW